MSKTAVLLSLGLLTVLLTGCGTTAKFIYPADSHKLIRISEKPVYQKKIAVTPFDEMRGSNNQSGTFLLYLIPLMPFGYFEYERPDAARPFLTVQEFNFNPSEDLAKAAAYSLRKSGLFKDAFFTFGGEKDKAQLLLEGEIISTKHIGTMWTYGLSIYAPLVWLFGVPIGTSLNNLALNLKLTNLASRKKIWKKSYNFKNKITQGLYYQMGHDVIIYPFLMQAIMNDAIKDMNAKLNKQNMK
jgi:hypothetical protein